MSRQRASVDAEALSELLNAVGQANEELDRLRAENARLLSALETIAEWDCLNPPDPNLCADHPWLKRLVDEAVKGARQ